MPGVLFDVLEQADPHRGDAGADRDAFVLDQLDQRRGVGAVLAGVDVLRPGHGRGVGHAPRVGVEHRHHREDRVALGDPDALRQVDHVAVQHHRTVRVDDAFRVPGGAARVAHGRGVVLVEVGPVERG